VGEVLENAGIRSGDYGVLKAPKRPWAGGTNHSYIRPRRGLSETRGSEARGEED
jgi:hypothetical protein